MKVFATESTPVKSHMNEVQRNLNRDALIKRVNVRLSEEGLTSCQMCLVVCKQTGVVCASDMPSSAPRTGWRPTDEQSEKRRAGTLRAAAAPSRKKFFSTMRTQ